MPPATPESQGVLFVPCTPAGELAKVLREEEGVLMRITDYTIKVVEKSVSSLKSLLQQTDPWKDLPCPRSSCMVCKRPQGATGTCRAGGVVYSIFCHKCELNGSLYVAETSRVIFERSEEHKRDVFQKEPRATYITTDPAATGTSPWLR